MKQTISLERELMLAKNIALQTWTKIAPFYDGKVIPTAKGDGTPVTEADKLANKFIIEKLRESFPLDSIVSEEDQAIINGERTWYIDPIDGTKGFFKRNGQFAIHIGFCEKDSPVLGVVYWSAVGDLYYGLKDHGAWRENNRGITELKIISTREKGLTAIMNDPFAPEHLRPIFKEIDVQQYHSSGSEGLRLMKIAENRADIRINESASGPSTWDLCAPHAIIEAAGGIMKYLDGNTIKYEQQRVMGKLYFAANNKNLADKVIEAYRRLHGN